MKLKDIFNKARSNPLGIPPKEVSDQAYLKFQTGQLNRNNLGAGRPSPFRGSNNIISNKNTPINRPSPFSNPSPIPNGAINTAQKEQAPASSSSRLFNESETQFKGTTTPTENTYQSKYINPETGQRYDPSEYSQMMATRLSGGAVGTLAGNQFKEGQSTQDLINQTREATNARNDIATGAADPYRVGKDSGISYTPAELRAIENAQAGTYDPALQNSFSRLETSQRADAQAAEDARMERQLELQNKYKLEQMGEQSRFNQSDAAFEDSLDTSGSGSYDGEFADSIRNAAALSGSVTGAETAAADLEYFMQNGNYNAAYERMQNLVADDLGGEAKKKFQNRARDIIAMERLKGELQTYADNGGEMGLLTGTEEQIKRKLGIDSGKASVMASNLWGAFQEYRSDMSGAAFGAAESRDYASVNPTLGKSLDLNMSVIDGAINKLSRSVESTMSSKISGSSELRELANQQRSGTLNGDLGLSQSEIEEFKAEFGYDPTSFSSVGNTKDSNKVSFADSSINRNTELAKAMQAISNVESRGAGGYNARGPVVTKGMYKGERALGRYQVMPGNLPEWSRQALGIKISPEQFMSNPDLQDRIVAHQFEKNKNRYGNWEDAASVWFTGKPRSQGGNARDDLGTSGNQYVAKFSNELRNIG